MECVEMAGLVHASNKILVDTVQQMRHMSSKNKIKFDCYELGNIWIEIFNYHVRHAT